MAISSVAIVVLWSAAVRHRVGKAKEPTQIVLAQVFPPVKFPASKPAETPPQPTEAPVIKEPEAYEGACPAGVPVKHLPPGERFVMYSADNYVVTEYKPREPAREYKLLNAGYWSATNPYVKSVALCIKEH